MTKRSMLKHKPPSTPRGGYIVGMRVGGSPRLKCSPTPYEHGSLASARAEAKALAARYGSEFVVFKELAPVAARKKVGA